MKISGVLFDFDGTLANTNDLIIQTFKHTLKEILDIEASEKEITKYFGLPLRECLGGFNTDRLDELVDFYRDYNLAHHDELIKGYPKVKETLTKLKENHIKNCVVTSKKVPMATRGLNCLNLYDLVDGIIGCDECEKHKPDPEPMLLGSKMLNLKPTECLCVGDSPFDLISGKACGCTTVAVNWSRVDRKAFDGLIKADYRIDEMPELLDIIDHINGKR